MRGLEGKNAIVTGGSSGIGQAIAIRLGQEGVNVAINYVGTIDGACDTKSAIEQTAIERGLESCVASMQSNGTKPIVVEADVSNEAQVSRMFDEVRSAYGSIDILINNAGIQIAEDSDRLSVDAFDRVLSVNLRGSFLCAQHAIRDMLEHGRGGSIVNVSSVHQIIPKPRFLGYSVSKGGMQNLTRTLALEYAGRDIRVNAVAPGATITPINRAWADDPAKRALVAQHIPMRRAAESEEMAAATAFLCSGEAAYVTGQTLFVDGGLTLYADFESTWSSE